MKKCKWCQQIGCNKKATNWLDKTFKLRTGEVQQFGFCKGHYDRYIDSNKQLIDKCKSFVTELCLNK